MKYLTILAAILFSACMNENLPDYHKVNSLRVLAIIADNPEINGTGTAIISFLVSDTRGDGRSLTFDSDVCVDPGITYGATPTCDGNPTKIALANNQSVSGLAAPDYTGVITETLTVTPGTTAPSSAIIFAGRTSDDQFNGIALLVTFNLSSADGDSVKSFKRVIVSTRSILNSNPTFSADAILADGSVLASMPSSNVDLEADFTLAGESYQEKSSSGGTLNLNESILTSWFVSDGSVDPGRVSETDKTEYDPKVATDGRNNLVIGIARDGRGGVAYAIKTL